MHLWIGDEVGHPLYMYIRAGRYLNSWGEENHNTLKIGVEVDLSDASFSVCIDRLTGAATEYDLKVRSLLPETLRALEPKLL